MAQGIKLGEASKILSEKWKGLEAQDPERHAHFLELAAKEKEHTAGLTASARSKDPTKPKPKRAPSAYILYCKEVRSTVMADLASGAAAGSPPVKLPDISRECGRRWKALPGDERGRWTAMSNELKATLAS